MHTLTKNPTRMRTSPPPHHHPHAPPCGRQVSDMHISRYAHPDIAPDLEVFGASVLAGLRPSALLLTGDLVDAKTANLEGSKQHVEEWQVRAAGGRVRRDRGRAGAGGGRRAGRGSRGLWGNRRGVVVGAASGRRGGCCGRCMRGLGRACSSRICGSWLKGSGRGSRAVRSTAAHAPTHDSSSRGPTPVACSGPTPPSPPPPPPLAMRTVGVQPRVAPHGGGRGAARGAGDRPEGQPRRV